MMHSKQLPVPLYLLLTILGTIFFPEVFIVFIYDNATNKLKHSPHFLGSLNLSPSRKPKIPMLLG